MGPEALEEMISAFARLPGIGRKTAQRLAFHIVKRPPREAETLAAAIVDGRNSIQYCGKCYNFTDKGETACAICRDETRDPGIICVVEEASHVLVLERSRLFTGTYHVLGGALSPLDGVGPGDLRIDELVSRVSSQHVTEVILANNASAEGEATAEYIQRMLGPLTVVSRLARGLPVGSDLDLADKVTLAHALQGRRSF
ncbi:MAG: recombination mediator RecR [Gemmatimonadetes bacterium]|nr:recombination mediator RecR [Gemmatimonadota bacterium]